MNNPETIEAQIKHMVDRFLTWEFPATMNPDGGISLKAGSKPVGTNLLSATEATAMVRHMLKELPLQKGTKVSWLAEGATIRGTGVVISDEEDGHVLVAVDKGVFEHIPTSYHMVIRCTVTWLTVEV